MSVSVFHLVRDVLKNATDSMSVADIKIKLPQLHPDSIRRCLRTNHYTFKHQPGKRGSKLWALDNGHQTALNFLINTTTQTAPNYKGMNLMCSPNKPSLIRAVGDLLVAEFVTGGNPFSAHDVTKRLREVELNRAKNATLRHVSPFRIPTPLIDKDETGEVYYNGYRLPKIEHEDVKNIVHDIFTAGGMPDLDRIMEKGHLEYDTKDKIADRVLARMNSIMD